MEGCCTNAEDKFLPRLQALATWVDDLDSVRGDTNEQLEVLKSVPVRWGNGHKRNWGDHEGKADRLGHIRTQCKQFQQHAGEPFRIHSVEPLRMTTRQQRQAAIARPATTCSR
jgi:hypothetical protein